MAKNNPSNGISRFAIIAFVVLLLDQLTKRLVLGSPAIDLGLFEISLTKNTGISFGMLQDTGIFPTIIALIIIVGLLYYYPKIPKKNSYQLLTAFILGGALGNLIDRFAYGFVIDFIDFGFWPAFNIADAAITIGALGLMYLLWKEK